MGYIPNINPTRYLPGMVTSTNPVISKTGTCQTTSILRFGYAAALSTSNPSTSTPSGPVIVPINGLEAQTYGVLRLTQRFSRISYDSLGNMTIYEGSGLPNGETGSLILGGEVAVFSETWATPGQPVFMRYTGITPTKLLGAFRNDSDGLSCVLTPWRFTNSTEAGGLVTILVTTPSFTFTA
jgi:hypothetical protein